MRWMVLILGLFLSGCYAHYQTRYQGPPPLQSTSMAQVDAMVGAQQPAAYKVGFMEGCDSGHLSAGDTSFLFKKDTNRFDTDDAYKQGWNDGFNRCVSGAGTTTGSYYQSYYGSYNYYPGTFYSGFYYPSYFYAPGYSIWLGYYGYPRHTHVHRHNYYYSPWYGGRKHWRGGNYYVEKHRGRGHGKGNKGWGGKGRGKKSGGGRGGGRYWTR